MFCNTSYIFNISYISLPVSGYPLNDLIQPGYVFFVLIDGIFICIAIIIYINVKITNDCSKTLSYDGKLLFF